MESTGAFSNATATNVLEYMDPDFGILREFFDIDLAGFSPTTSKPDWPTGLDAIGSDWNFQHDSSNDDQGKGCITNTITPKKTIARDPGTNDFCNAIPCSPFPLTHESSGRECTESSTLRSTLKMQPFHHTVLDSFFAGSNLETPGGLELEPFTLSQTERLQESELNKHWTSDIPFCHIGNSKCYGSLTPELMDLRRFQMGNPKRFTMSGLLGHGSLIG